jgi:hypothetical protein
MTNSWMNEDGEPIMDGAAWRFEQQLDMDSADDYYADHFYDDEDYYDDDEEEDEDDEDFDPIEDQWLDSYMEDRLTTMYE